MLSGTAWLFREDDGVSIEMRLPRTPGGYRFPSWTNIGHLTHTVHQLYAGWTNQLISHRVGAALIGEAHAIYLVVVERLGGHIDAPLRNGGLHRYTQLEVGDQK